VKTYHVRLDGMALEVAVDDAPPAARGGSAPAARGGAAGGLRVAVIRRDFGAPRRVDLAEIVPGWYSLMIDGRSHTLAIAAWRIGPSGDAGGGSARHWTLLFDGVAVTADVGRSPRARGGAQSAAGAAGQIRAPMPGLVVAIQVGPGTAVVSGQPLIIMEAMKMQMEIRAPHAGVVREVRVIPGQDVAGNDLLVTVD